MSKNEQESGREKQYLSMACDTMVARLYKTLDNVCQYKLRTQLQLQGWLVNCKK